VSWRVSRRRQSRGEAVAEASFAVTCHSKRARDAVSHARLRRLETLEPCPGTPSRARTG